MNSSTTGPTNPSLPSRPSFNTMQTGLNQNGSKLTAANQKTGTIAPRTLQRNSEATTSASPPTLKNHNTQRGPPPNNPSSEKLANIGIQTLRIQNRSKAKNLLTDEQLLGTPANSFTPKKTSSTNSLSDPKSVKFSVIEQKNEGISGDTTPGRVDEHKSDDSNRSTQHLSIFAKAELTRLKETLPKDETQKENSLVACGSITLTSDNDYTFLGKPRKILPGGRQFRDPTSRDQAFENIINKHKQLIASANKGAVISKMDLSKNPETKDNTGFTRTLEPNLKQNALNALAKSDYNWFTALKTYACPNLKNGKPNPDYNPQVIWDIRSLEKEITKDLAQSIEDSYSNLSETDMVQLTNQGIREIFGKEAGDLFDTNYYTGHAILQEGFNITNPEQKIRWKEGNQLQSLLKVASNFKANFGENGLKKFNEFCTNSGFDPQEIGEKTWKKMNVREDVIKTQTQLVTENTKKEIDSLSLQLKTLPEGPDKNYVSNRIYCLNSKLESPEQLELEAMNDLYMAALETTQEKMNLFEDEKDKLNSTIESFAKTAELSKTEELSKKAKIELKEMIQSGKFDEVQKKINFDDSIRCLFEALKESQDLLANDIIDAQMTTLLFANEPYYSQATVVGIVGEMQMGKDAATYPLLSDRNTYKMCMTENFGDFTKDKHHYADPAQFAFKGSKYLFRTMFSAEKSLDTNSSTYLRNDINKMKNLSESLLNIRKNEGTPPLSVEQQKSKSMKLIRDCYELGDSSNCSDEDAMQFIFKTTQSIVQRVNKGIEST